MRYPQIHDGEVVIPEMAGWKMRCCDCGLVHRFTFAVVKDGRRRRVAFSATRDNRATAQVRRHQQQGRP